MTKIKFFLLGRLGLAEKRELETRDVVGISELRAQLEATQRELKIQLVYFNIHMSEAKIKAGPFRRNINLEISKTTRAARNCAQAPIRAGTRLSLQTCSE